MKKLLQVVLLAILTLSFLRPTSALAEGNYLPNSFASDTRYLLEMFQSHFERFQEAKE